MVIHMDTKKVVLVVPSDWLLGIEREAHDRYMTVSDLMREKMGCAGVPRGRPLLSSEEKQHELEGKARKMIGLVLQEVDMLRRGEKLTPGVGIEPQFWCAKRDLGKLGLWDERLKVLKLRGTPYEDLQPPSPAVSSLPTHVKKGEREA